VSFPPIASGGEARLVSMASLLGGDVLRDTPPPPALWLIGVFMRRVIGGNGQDNTAATQAWLASGKLPGGPPGGPPGAPGGFYVVSEPVSLATGGSASYFFDNVIGTIDAPDLPPGAVITAIYACVAGSVIATGCGFFQIWAPGFTYGPAGGTIKLPKWSGNLLLGGSLRGEGVFEFAVGIPGPHFDFGDGTVVCNLQGWIYTFYSLPGGGSPGSGGPGGGGPGGGGPGGGVSRSYYLRDLILIGYPEDPRSIWLTNHEGPVVYTPYGLFNPAVVTRDKVQAKIGLDSQKIKIIWSPSNNASTVNTETASPAQRARLHVYDNWPVRIFRAFMLPPGDANTLGCADWFGGRVDTVDVERNKLTFNVDDYMAVLSQKVPSTVIETTNTLAGTAAVTLPAGETNIPVFACHAGSSEDHIIADCLSPTAGHIYDNNRFVGGYMVFLSGPGSTLSGAWSAVGENGRFTDGSGGNHSDFEIYNALPWPPTPGVDTFYVSAAAPINLGDENYYGFPYVPNPQSGV
jgi:hypothetical protein